MGLTGYVRGVTKRPRRERTAFVLGGGGVLGALQVGQHFVRKGDHLYSNSGIRGLISRVPATRFEDLALPMSVVAANLRTGAEMWFDDGALEPALLASTALPGIFPPVQIDGELLVDGGVVNNVPISRAVELGATKIYVLRCGSIRSGEHPIRRPLDVLMAAVAHSRGVRVDIDMTRYSHAAEIHVLPMFEPGVLRFDDPSHSADLIEHSRELAAGYLSSSQLAIPR
ncbi:MAG: patatin-like phospholipase family protein [Actinobacteria bacterium]|nr:patatin-like phospholipase family protein [Actinomycetota bacterium]